MKIRRHSKAYNFIGDTKTGVTFRWGESFKENPSVAPWPELADISISNHCSKGCEYCYRDSTQNNSFMSLADYKLILDKLNHPKWGNVFQIALGGGEPLEHPQLKEIIETTVSYDVVPNLTTNGSLLTEKNVAFLRDKVGAIAISVANITEVDIHKVELLRKNNIKTNIHYLLRNDNIEQGVALMKGFFNKYISEVNSIIFLTHKPFGRASVSNCLVMNKALKTFIQLIEKGTVSTRIGFDACFVPMLLHLTNTNVDFIDSCECSLFSVFIDEELYVKPCSFTNERGHAFNLRNNSFEDIWERKFKTFRDSFINNCVRECKSKEHCRGACVYFDEINYCYSESQEEALRV